MNLESLRARAEALRLNGLLAHWHEAATADWSRRYSTGKRASDLAVAWSGG